MAREFLHGARLCARDVLTARLLRIRLASGWLFGADTISPLAPKGEGDYEHYCSLFINGAEYEEKFGNIIFVYDTVRHEFVRSIYF